MLQQQQTELQGEDQVHRNRGQEVGMMRLQRWLDLSGENQVHRGRGGGMVQLQQRQRQSDLCEENQVHRGSGQMMGGGEVMQQHQTEAQVQQQHTEAQGEDEISIMSGNGMARRVGGGMLRLQAQQHSTQQVGGAFNKSGDCSMIVCKFCVVI